MEEDSVSDSEPVCSTSRWKKLENALRFIKATRRLSKDSKKKNCELIKSKKRSKWTLVKNVLSAVNYLVRISLRNLEIQSHESGIVNVECIESPAYDKIVVQKVEESQLLPSPQSCNKYWRNIRNSLHWIR